MSKLGSNEEESSLENGHRVRNRDSVEVFELDGDDEVVVRLECEAKEVALFSLEEDEVHALCAMHGRARHQDAALGVFQIVPATRYRTADVWLVAEVLVDQSVLATDNYS